MKLVFASSLVATSYAASWGYETQPWQMGYCKPTEYARQSPIDIVTSDVVKAVGPDTLIKAGDFTKQYLQEHHYDVTVNDIDSAGAHSITFSFTQEIGDEKFACPQFHCHFADSEHAIDGKKTFGECHTVCYDKEIYGSFGNATRSINGDELAVFGFFIEEDAHVGDNAAVDSWIAAKNGFTNTSNVVEVQIATPNNTDKYLRYLGGLTTPGCNPIVQWTVFAESVKISTAQKLEILSWSSGHMIGNNREVQPMNGRVVTCYGCEDDFENDDEDDEDQDCENKKFIIREDGTIRPGMNLDACVGVSTNKNRAKLMWVNCDKNEMNDDINLEWSFEKHGNHSFGYVIRSMDDGHDHEHPALAWSIRSPSRAANQMVFLKEQAAGMMEKQMFVFEHGMIWLRHKNGEQNYCVSFEGEGEKVKTRKCWKPLAGEYDF
jgi:carbonic anhydrase